MTFRCEPIQRCRKIKFELLLSDGKNKMLEEVASEDSEYGVNLVS